MDKMQMEHRTFFGSNAATEIEYSGVVDDHLWLMSDVEVTPLLKGHTFPTKECGNIHSWISLSGNLVFSHQQGIYGFKFPKKFWKSLTEISLFSQS
jgi:hypothetical protein